mmetsp:Transcript_11390/g.16577  ORF Transcript_11390/g.16577 Transcript_11390/m.16577 type:complete len:278 (+) Transcript_11390:127-960(+)
MGVTTIIDRVQFRLDFRHWKEFPQFTSDQGLGRVALIAFVLSSIFTIHALALSIIVLDKLGVTNSPSLTSSAPLFLSTERLTLLIQWILYVLTLCIFHLSEFFVTALYNPTVVNASSFVVNHSKSYTIAMMVSWTEFFIRFFIFPSLNSVKFAVVGMIFVVIGQAVRSLAMITCGESFNHIIQNFKKKNHVLVTSGIYNYLRHPSYFGFFYWSIGTQMMTGNFLTSICFAAASWTFFKRRIPFEEGTLMKIFPEDYPTYQQKTIIGIPFIKTYLKTD